MTNMDPKKLKALFKNYEAVGESGYRHFAVLVPVIYDDNKEPSLLFEVRSSQIDRQPGEICFPGGMIEEGESPRESVLREMEEETGISEDRIEIIAKLPSISIANSSVIHVYLGILSGQALAEAAPSQDEVAELFTVELSYFLNNNPRIYTCGMIPQPDENFPYEEVTGKKSYNWKEGRHIVPVYDEKDGHVIWGITARITRQLVEELKVLQKHNK